MSIVSCGSNSTSRNIKEAWKSRIDNNTIVAYYFNSNQDSPIVGDFYPFTHENGTLLVSAFHNPKRPLLFVTLRKENKDTFDLSTFHIKITSGRLGALSFVKEDKSLKKQYKTLRYQLDLIPADYDKLINDTIKISLNNKEYLFVGKEKSIKVY